MQKKNFVDKLLSKIYMANTKNITGRVLMALLSGQGGDNGDPHGHPEAGHITKCDNIARCHLTMFADL